MFQVTDSYVCFVHGILNVYLSIVIIIFKLNDILIPSLELKFKWFQLQTTKPTKLRIVHVIWTGRCHVGPMLVQHVFKSLVFLEQLNYD